MLKNKGFLGMTTISYIWRFLITIFVLIAFVLIVKSQVAVEYNYNEAELNIAYYTLIYSQNGVSYYDKLKERIYPGVIDLDKFQDEDFQIGLEKLFNFQDKDTDRLGFHIELQDGRGDTIEDFYIFEKTYTRLIPYSYGAKGPGASTKKTHVTYSLIKKKEGELINEELESARLIVTVVKSNS